MNPGTWLINKLRQAPAVPAPEAKPKQVYVRCATVSESLIAALSEVSSVPPDVVRRDFLGKFIRIEIRDMARTPEQRQRKAEYERRYRQRLREKKAAKEMVG